jgi:hypothetical protein
MSDYAGRRGFSLRRWSARKREATHAALARAVPVSRVSPAEAADATPGAQSAVDAAPGSRGAVDATPADMIDSSAPVPAGRGNAATSGERVTVEAALPPIDSLTPQSDFTPFMRPDIDPKLRTAALHKLFSDPRFNVMDGLDVYIDDYSKPDPIPPELVRTLAHARYIFAPPQTRVNEQGYVEDVPVEEESAAAATLAAASEAAPAAPPAPMPSADPGSTEVAVPVPASDPVAEAGRVSDPEPVRATAATPGRSSESAS